jgi:hypothetical protein
LRSAADRDPIPDTYDSLSYDMASALPAKLKAAAPDVQRFATRAVQLEKFRPIVSYWCMFYQYG